MKNLICYKQIVNLYTKLTKKYDFMLYFNYVQLMIKSMKLSLLDIIRLGRKYCKLWPERAELGEYFRAYQAVQVGRFACKYLPGLALFVFIIQLYFGSLSILPQAVVYALFILSMPVQALVVLGLKADKLSTTGF